MQTDNRLLDDLARVASGAFSALSGVREEVETRAREQFEKILSRLDLVTREEFEAVKSMASRARVEQEVLAARLVLLEKKLAGVSDTTADTSEDVSPLKDENSVEAPGS